MNPAVTLAICSNRPPRLLPRLLEILAQEPALAKMPLFWVDNTPDRPWREELQALLESRPHTRCLHAPTPGLSHARNVAMAACQTPWLAFLDDDALPRPLWPGTLFSLLEQTPADTAMLGGPVLPVWPHTPPGWLGTALSQYLALVNWAPAPTLLRPRQWIAGANMILRTETLRRVGGFPTHLGRRGRNLLSMEESALGRALEAAGYQRRFHPELEVDHLLDPQRLNCLWFWKRAWWQGVSEALAPQMPREPHPRPYRLIDPPGLHPQSLAEPLMLRSCQALSLLGRLAARLHPPKP